MNTRILLFILISVNLNICAQKDSLELDDKYLEDQFYIDITYNVLYNQPKNVKESDFSYGFSVGYIRDFPIIKNGKVAIGIGLGYGYDRLVHGLKVTKGESSNDFFEISEFVDNKINTHNLEVPFQIRFRSSDAKKYSFWRIYSGVKMSYNLANSFSHKISETLVKVNNIKSYRRFQIGATLSAGYATFNFHIYYGLTPFLNSEAFVDKERINTRIIKFGISFFVL